MPKTKTRLWRVTHNINTHRIQVHESVLCSVGFDVQSILLGAGQQKLMER
jgi:hypothetical protein